MIFDTIVGKATASGPAALNIIRASGDDAVAYVNNIFRGSNLEKAASHTVTYGRIVVDDEVLDEVMVSVFRKPHSFTCEDVVEITCHGGDFVASEIIRAILGQGARMAHPGEFTRRAYLNGRIDLTEAESIMDVISAKTKTQLTLAQSALRGDVKRKVQDLQKRILNLIAEIEVNIDYPEYDDAIKITTDILEPRINDLLAEIRQIVAKASTGRIIRDGIKAVIIGKPNVGKSSLLNSLAKEDRAIVTEVSGTTRDLIEVELNLDGLLVRLVDTAGIRDTYDTVEKIGIERAKKALGDSDLVLLVLDQSDVLTEQDHKLLDLTKDRKRIIVGNKIDLGKKAEFETENIVNISAKNNIGIDELAAAVKALFVAGNCPLGENALFANIRHVAKLEETLTALVAAETATAANMPVDMIAIDLYAAWRHLGEITGESSGETLLDELFSRFCLGK